MTLEDKIKLYAEKGIPVMLWGLPGIGKTERVKALAKREGWHLEELALNVLEPPDLGGLPVRTDDGVVLYPPAWAKRLIEAAEKGRTPAIFMDEINTAPPAVQKPAYRLVREHYAGETKLPDNTIFIAAGNPPQVAGAWDLDPPLANRFVHIEVRANLDEWKSWAIGRSQGHARVAAFLTAKPSLLIRYPTDQSLSGLAWPSPRSWDHVAKVINHDLPDEELAEVIAEIVGEGPAAEFVAWVRKAELVDPKRALEDPHGFPIPKRDDAAFALVYEATSIFMEQPDKRRWNNLWDIYVRLLDAGYRDIAAAGASMAVEIYTKNLGQQLPVPKQVVKFGDYLNSVIMKVRG